MTDVVDLASNQEQANLEDNLAMHRLNSRKTLTPRPEGYCHSCHDDVEGVQLFCNSDCAKDYERRNSVAKF